MNWKRRLTKDVWLTLNWLRYSKSRTVPFGTLLDLKYHRGEKVVVIQEGRFNGWYFTASDRWLLQNTEEVWED